MQCAFRSHQARTEAIVYSANALTYAPKLVVTLSSVQSPQTIGKKFEQQQKLEQRERAATKLQALKRGAKTRRLVKEKVRGSMHISAHAHAVILNLRFSLPCRRSETMPRPKSSLYHAAEVHRRHGDCQSYSSCVPVSACPKVLR